MLKRCCLIVLLLLLAAGCGEVPTAPPGQGSPLVVEQPSALPAQEPTPAVDQSGWTVLPADTPIPYPLPTREPRTAPPLPTATPLPVVPVLGAEWAPETERQTYVSTAVVVAKVGDGPGQLGFYRAQEGEIPTRAEHFALDAHGNIYILDVVNQRVVKFDPGGRFVANIVYGDAVQGPGDLAVDADGRVYIYEVAAYGPTPEEAVPKVKLFDPEGKLLWETPVPSWFMDRLILGMRVDEQGTLWVQGEGYSPNAPIIDGQPYSKVAVPLGNAAGVLGLDEDGQKALAVSGHLLPSGKPMIVRSLTAAGPAFVYNSSGQPIYQVVEGISAIDLAGNLYYFEEGDRGYTIVKWDPKGQRIASFDLPFGIIRVEGDGTVYCFTMDWQTWATYYVIRAEHK
jgi:hypothetical protein